MQRIIDFDAGGSPQLRVGALIVASDLIITDGDAPYVEVANTSRLRAKILYPDSTVFLLNTAILTFPVGGPEGGAYGLSFSVIPVEPGHSILGAFLAGGTTRKFELSGGKISTGTTGITLAVESLFDLREFAALTRGFQIGFTYAKNSDFPALLGRLPTNPTPTV